MPFNTYIDDKDMIPVLLEHDWIILKNTWTDCPYPIYRAFTRCIDIMVMPYLTLKEKCLDFLTNPFFVLKSLL